MSGCPFFPWQKFECNYITTYLCNSFINGHFICLCILSGVSNAALKLAPTLNTFAFLLEIGLIFSIHSNYFSIKKMIILCDKNTHKFSEILFKIISVFGMKWFCYSSSIQIRLNLCLSVSCSLQIQLNHKAIQHWIKSLHICIIYIKFTIHSIL